MSKTIYIGGRLESKEKGNVVTGANAILDDTKGKKQNVINKETDDELLRLEQSKQDNLTFDNAPTEDSTNPVTSGGVYTAEKALSDAIEAILLLIPSAATALNKLVDTNTMNSSISTATATFRGTYNAVSDLGLTYQATHAQIEAALDALGMTADNNDFAFVQIPVSDQSQDIAKTERFKFNGTNWLYEYDLNTSGFTAAQWAAINSGITVALVTKLTDLPTAAALQLALNAKQDTLTFDTEPTALSQNPVTSGGIYTAIQAIATALSDYSTTTDGRLGVLEGLIPSEAASNNKLTDKAYVDGLIQAITELIPAEATTSNQLADKAYVLASILAATPAFNGQFTTLAELQAVASPKDGDLGIVRTKDSDGMDVFTVYQYLNNAWGVFYSLSYHPQTKPATTGTTGDYPYNGMGRVELAKNMVNTGTELAPVYENQLTQDMFYKGAVGSRVPNTNTIFVIQYDYVLGEDVTIPANSVLCFEGGSITASGNNDTITGQNTNIQAGLVKIFNSNVTLAGTWNVAEAYPEWFGAKGDGVSDDRPSIQKCIDCFYKTKIINGEYLIASYTDVSNKIGIVIPNSRIIEGNCVNQYSQMAIIASPSLDFNFLIGLQGRWITMENLGVRGVEKTQDDRSSVNVDVLIGSISISTFNPSLNLSHIYGQSANYGLKIYTYGSSISDCSFALINTTTYYFSGITASTSTARGTSLKMTRCASFDCYGTAFDISRMSYCEFDLCGGDRNGYIPDNVTAENIFPVFRIEDSNCLSFRTCCIESACKVIDISVSKNIIFEGCEFVELQQINTTYLYNIASSANVSIIRNFLNNSFATNTLKFINIQIQSPYAGAKILLKDNYHLVSGSSLQYLLYNNINIVNDVSEGIELNNPTMQLDRTSAGYGIPALLSTYTNIVPLKITSTNALYSTEEIVIKNKPTKVIIDFAGYSVYFRSGAKFTIENCECVEIVNATLREGGSPSSVASEIFSIKNSKVIFRNCSLNIEEFSASQYFFDSENSDIELVNCDINNSNNRTIVKTPNNTAVYTIVKDNMVQKSKNCIWLNTSGTFANKPAGAVTPVGFNYFCTDKQTTEGAVNGIEIIHKGSGVWVDALGRVVS